MLTKILKIFKTENQELLRKIIHIGMGPLLPIAKFLHINQSTALLITGMICILILINYIYKLFPIIEDIDRKSFGTLFYCISIFVLITLFWEKDTNALIIGYFIMAFGDGLAGLIGKNYKSKNWLIFKQKKSVLGTIVMFLSSLIIIILAGYFNGYIFNINYLVIPIIATFLEQFSFVGIDNLTVPIISAISFNLLITNS